MAPQAYFYLILQPYMSRAVLTQLDPASCEDSHTTLGQYLKDLSDLRVVTELEKLISV